MYRTFFLLVSLTSLLASCNPDTEEGCAFQPDTSTEVKLDLEVLHDSLTNFASKEDLVKFLTDHPVLRDHIFRREEFPNDSIFINELYSRFTNPHVDTLVAEVKKIFGDGSGLKAEFETAFSNLKYYYPQIRSPKIQTVVTGLLGTDLLVTDSLIVVSLDFFLGKEAKYRPKMYDYLLRKYDPNDIVPSCMLIYGINGNVNKSQPADQTVLADMIVYGKA